MRTYRTLFPILLRKSTEQRSNRIAYKGSQCMYAFNTTEDEHVSWNWRAVVPSIVKLRSPPVPDLRNKTCCSVFFKDVRLTACFIFRPLSDVSALNYQASLKKGSAWWQLTRVRPLLLYVCSRIYENLSKGSKTKWVLLYCESTLLRCINGQYVKL